MTEMTEKAIGWLQHLIDSAERGVTTPLEQSILLLVAAIADAVDTPSVTVIHPIPGIPVHFVDDDREWVNRVIFADNND